MIIIFLITTPCQDIKGGGKVIIEEDRGFKVLHCSLWIVIIVKFQDVDLTCCDDNSSDAQRYDEEDDR